MIEVVELTLFYLLQRPIVHSPYSELTFQVISYSLKLMAMKLITSLIDPTFNDLVLPFLLASLLVLLRMIPLNFSLFLCE